MHDFCYPIENNAIARVESKLSSALTHSGKINRCKSGIMDFRTIILLVANIAFEIRSLIISFMANISMMLRKYSHAVRRITPLQMILWKNGIGFVIPARSLFAVEISYANSVWLNICLRTCR